MQRSEAYRILRYLHTKPDVPHAFTVILRTSIFVCRCEMMVYERERRLEAGGMVDPSQDRCAAVSRGGAVAPTHTGPQRDYSPSLRHLFASIRHWFHFGMVLLIEGMSCQMYTVTFTVFCGMCANLRLPKAPGVYCTSKRLKDTV